MTNEQLLKEALDCRDRAACLSEHQRRVGSSVNLQAEVLRLTRVAEAFEELVRLRSKASEPELKSDPNLNGEHVGSNPYNGG